MKSELNLLLDKLCVEQGFCLPENVTQDILSKNIISADGFTKSILIGEGLNPDMELAHYRNIKRIFTELFGKPVTPISERTMGSGLVFC